ncbi:MAG: hypothetical protein ACOYNF_14230 [Rhodoferax sp.]
MAIVGTGLAVGAIIWLMGHSRWQPWVRSLSGVVPPFINVIGVLFGLTLAFIANDTWNAHDKATNAVYREADALRSLVLLAGKLNPPLRQQLHQALKNLAQSSSQEWLLLARRQSSPTAAADADALLLLASSPALAAEAGSPVQTLILNKTFELRNDRNLRIGLSQMHVNPLKWLGMAFLGLLTLLSIAVVHAGQPRAASVSIILFALSAAPTAAIVLIQGNPFQMPSSVSPAPIIAAVKDEREKKTDP